MGTYSATVAQRGVIGNLDYEIWNLTNVQADSSSTVVVGMQRPLIAIPIANGAASLLITVVSISDKTVTLDGSAEASGQLMVIGQ